MNLRYILIASICLVTACNNEEEKNAGSVITAFTGAALIDGNGGEPVKDAVLIIRDGKIVSAGSKQSIAIPADAKVIDVSGKTIMPGIINGHGHVGDVVGIEPGHYSGENVLNDLSLYARYGITTVISLGNDKKAAASLRAVNDSNVNGHARLYIAGDIVNGKDINDALAVLDSNISMGIDFVKVRIDDQLGTSSKMPEDIYRAVIKRAHELNYKVAAHLYYLGDAKKLVDAGADILAHSIRDLAADDSVIRIMKSKAAAYIPTFTRELSTYVYADTPAFFSDPFFTREYDISLVQPLLDPAKQQQVKNSKAGQTYKKQLPVAYANLKKLQDSGILIIFGTDSGVATRFIGYFEHVEMEMMRDAGLTPMQIILSATKNAAAGFGLKNTGTLDAGNFADFLILDANPLDDIKNIHKISAVYINGAEVPKK